MRRSAFELALAFALGPSVVAAIGSISACRRGESTDEAPPPRRSASAGWLTDITDDAGLDFVYDSGPFGNLYMPEIMGGGAALVDLDNDGDLDVYLTNGHNELPGHRGSGEVTNRLFRREADGRYVDATAGSGLGDAGYGMGVAVGDIDNDGDRDVYVTNLGPDRLFRNRGDGTFEDVTEAAGIDVPGWSCSACYFDVDRDGFLDLYVTQYVQFHPNKTCSDMAGRREYCGPTAFPAVHDVLLRNNGDGTFSDVSETAGILDVPAGAGLGVVCEDFNDDGWIDVYVANDAYANNLWINKQDGTFRDDALVLGVAYNMHGHAEAGMGVVAADFDNDRYLDLFMTHLTRESNTIYRNTGPSGFADMTGESGLGSSSMVFTGFGTAALDLELDGDLDLLVVNGRVTTEEKRYEADIGPPFDRYAEPNLLYLNHGDGRFTDRNDLAPSFTDRIEISRALAAGDVDGDGDLDVLLANIQSPARLYRNDAPRGGNWLIVRATDPRLNRDAIGAKVAIAGVAGPEGAGQRMTFHRTISGAFSYLTASEPVAHFGLGPMTEYESVEVQWPDGLRERFPGGPTDRRVELRRGTGQAQP